MDVLMPQLGETVAEGKITQWFKSAGDAIKPGDNLFEIETDKVSMEVPSTTAGVLAEIRVPAGEGAPVGAVVAAIADGAAASAPPAAQGPTKPPVAAAGVTLAEGPSAEDIKAIYRDVPFQEVPLDGMRRIIATRLVQAKQTIPHFYLTADVEIGRLLTLREEANAAAPKDNDGKPAFKLSLNDLIIKAWAAALQRVPAANAVWAQDRILRLQHCDIGVAVALGGGLIAPVIRRAEVKSLSAISNEMKELAARARARKRTPDEYQGGCSAISNLGMYGVREFAAALNPPH